MTPARDLMVSPHDPMFRHATVKSNGIKLHYVTAGQGEPVLLWHGFLGTWYSWRRLIPMLAHKYLVIAPDMRGFGDSDKPPCDYDVLQLCEDFRGLLKSLDLQRIRLVGAGIGAPGALAWAAKYPDEVELLAYIDGPVLLERALDPLFRFNRDARRLGGLWWWGFAQASGLADGLIAGREREFLTWFYHNHAHSPSMVDDGLNEYLRTFSGRESVAAALGFYRSVFHSMDETGKLIENGKIKTPVMGLGGDKSLGMQVRQALEFAAEDVTGGVIENCGHFVAEEQPEALAGRLLSFFVTH